MKHDANDPTHYIADEGKVFKRKSDGFIYGEEMYLGYTYYINGEPLAEPKLETIDDFDEIVIEEEV